MEGKGEIGHGSWATRSVMGDEIETSFVMGNDEIERVTRSVMGNDERAMRSVMGNNGADEISFGWIGLRW